MSDQAPYPLTVVRRMTAAVSSAIATIAVDGPQAAEIVSAALHSPSGKKLRLTTPGARFARWRFSDTQMADEHIVVLVRSLQAVEVHCHGGLAITDQIIRQLHSAGCNSVDDYLADTDTRANTLFFDGSPIDLEHHVTDEAIESDARQALQAATTLKAALVWLEQYQGALAGEFTNLRQLVAARRKRAVVELCDVLLARASFGLKLLQPWRLTLAGPPNVGKSSLMNALCGVARVLVHHEPGTTRDAIATNLVIGDWPLVLTDTAGIRESSESVEQLGIQAAWLRWRTADLGLLVVDATVGWTSQHDMLLSGPAHIMIVINKVDAMTGTMPQLIESIRQHSGNLRYPWLPASAKSELGTAEIVRAIGDHLDSCRPPIGSAVPFTSEQVKWLQRQRSEAMQ